MDERDSISITLTKDEWKTIQNALDTYFYEVDHARHVDLTRSARRERAEDRQARLRKLAAIDRKIGEATGSGPVFG